MVKTDAKKKELMELPRGSRIIERWYPSFDERIIGLDRCREAIRFAQYVERTKHEDYLDVLGSFALTGVTRGSAKTVTTAPVKTVMVEDNNLIRAYFNDGSRYILCFILCDDSRVYADYDEIDYSLSHKHY